MAMLFGLIFTNPSLIRTDTLNGSNKHVLLPNTINELVALIIIYPSLQPQGKRRISNLD